MKPTVFNHQQYTDLEADYMILKAENEQLKAQLSATNNRLEAAVEFIKYLDRNYSGYMAEDERFSKWRGLREKGAEK